jgi:hypothetical protein
MTSLEIQNAADSPSGGFVITRVSAAKRIA